MNWKLHRCRIDPTGISNRFGPGWAVIIFAFSIIAVFTTGCGPTTGEEPSDSREVSADTGVTHRPPERKLTPEEEKLLAEPVAMVGDIEITLGDLKEQLQLADQGPNPAEDMGLYVPPPEDYYIKRWQTLDSLINRSIIEQEAHGKGIVVEQSEIDEQVVQIKKEILGVEDESGLDDVLFEQNLWDKLQLTTAQLEDELRSYLLQQKFFVASQEEIETELDNEAQEKTELIAGKLKDGEDFEDLVEEYSDDPAVKENGGVYENITHDSDQPLEIIDMAFGMEVDWISDPFKVVEEIDYGRGEPFIIESYVILELLEKSPTHVTYRIIKIDSNNISLQGQRAQDKLTGMKDTYEIRILDPQYSTWNLVRDSDFGAAREEWALYMAEADNRVEDPDSPAPGEEEKDDTSVSIEERDAIRNYISGLLYRIQIDGYRSQYGLNVTGEIEETRKGRWEKYNEDPETWGEDEPNLQEPTRQEKERYRKLSEEALPWFDLALGVVADDVHIFLHRGETHLELENYEAALADFEVAAGMALDDLILNGKLENDVSHLLGMFGDEENARRVRDLMDKLSEKVDRLESELKAAQQGMQGAGGVPPQN